MAKKYEKMIKMKFFLLSFFYDIFDLVFIFNQKQNPRKILSTIIPNNDIQILDLCTGTANSSIELAKKNNNNQIFGIDLSQDMINVANRKTIKLNLSNIKLNQMNALKLVFNDKKFDIVTTSFALHEMEKDMMNKVLKEMHRVLKDDGKIYIIDYNKQNGIKRILLWIFTRIFEPKHIKDFLNYNWKDIFNENGFRFENIISCLFSKIIIGRKAPNST